MEFKKENEISILKKAGQMSQWVRLLAMKV